MLDKKDVSNINLPNMLSILRILMIPIALWGMLKEEYALALAILVLAGITDALDGFLARALNQFTPVGRILDPMADKILFITLFSCMGFGLSLFPLWFTFVVLGRDILILLGYFNLRKKGKAQNLAPRFSGKAHTIILFLFLFGVLVSLSYDFPIPFNLMIYLVATTAFISVADYFLIWCKKRKA